VLSFGEIIGGGVDYVGLYKENRREWLGRAGIEP
jgi:hypothetical protein